MKSKVILEAVVLYSKESSMVYDESTKQKTKLPKYKTEVYIEDEIVDGTEVRPSSLKLKTNIAKDEFKKGLSRFEVEFVPYKIGNQLAENSIIIKKIVK